MLVPIQKVYVHNVVGESIWILLELLAVAVARNAHWVFVQNITGRAFCLPCTPGSYINLMGQAECKQCAVGRSSAAVAKQNECEECTSGRYQEEKGMAACLNCIPGKYAEATGSTSCTKCGAGQHQSCTRQ